jgi:hypothetical protein
MLETATIKKINEYVYQKPRSIQEIAHHIQKNWRTADTYVERISKETGSLATRVFREGTRGALKIVYWNNIERIHSLEFQEKLFKRIEIGKHKQDFSPFEIYQYVDDTKRDAFIEQQEDEAKVVKQDLFSDLLSAEKQILIFSGNFSWINLTIKGKKFTSILEELASRNISIKVITRIDLSTINDIKRALAVNERLGKDCIEFRHAEQPLRAFIIDQKVARFKEIRHLEDYKKKIRKKSYIFYNIHDPEWIDWLAKVFWNFFRTSIPAKKRIADLETIQKL